MTELPINQVVTGDCRKVMSDWPPNCIDFVMFSPPFWGLRDYGEEAESVWDEDENCGHKWGDKIPHPQSKSGKHTSDIELGAKDAQHQVREEGDMGSFCQKCGAWKGQLGLEPDYRMYVQHLVEVGREIKRILKPSGSWYLNLGDTYAGSGMGRSSVDPKWEGARKGEVDPPQQSSSISAKCKMLMPYRVALALIDDGWICRNDIIWLKPNPMPSSVKDRLNTTTERIFHFVQEKKYYYDLDMIREEYSNSSIQRVSQNNGNPNFNGDRRRSHPNNAKETLNPDQFTNPKGKSPGDMIEQTTQPFPEAHFAVYPPDLCEKPIKSSCPPKVCVECGTPFEREAERVDQGWDGSKYGERAVEATGGAISGGTNKSTLGSSGGKLVGKYISKGWQKTCDCNTDETRPGIVLDPMCGAGSTLVKAKQLGRRYIGIEISDEYAEIARERLEKGDEKYKRRKRKERRLKREAEGTTNLDEFV